MSPSTFAILLLLLGAIWSLIRCRSSNGRKLPPGPPALPVIGNLHMLGTFPHRNLQKLSEKYGPVMSLRLGSTPTIVISSGKAAELFLKTHDMTFANRPKTQVSECYSYGFKDIAFSDHGLSWRSARKVCALELLSSGKLDSYADMRREEIGLVVEEIKAAPPGEVVDFSKRVQRLTEDMIYRMVLGRRSDQCVHLADAIEKMVELLGLFNLSDFVPVLAPFDLQGIAGQMKTTKMMVDRLLEKLIDEHEQEIHVHQTQNTDFIHLLLSTMNKSSSNGHAELSYSIDRENMKAIALDMITGTIDTSPVAIEWIMTELLRHPRVMRKVHEEIASNAGLDRMVEEKDLSRFEYLEMVIKETLRLHPVFPLAPRASTEDVVIGDYCIPQKSRLYVNNWAIGRDHDVWSENAEEFLPERFVDSGIDLRGQHFQLIPFGAGRRVCPGMDLGMINIKLVVSQLVHCFNWELPDGMAPHELDMTGKIGLTLPRANHLFAVPRYRLQI